MGIVLKEIDFSEIPQTQETFYNINKVYHIRRSIVENYQIAIGLRLCSTSHLSLYYSTHHVLTQGASLLLISGPLYGKAPTIIKTITLATFS